MESPREGVERGVRQYNTVATTLDGDPGMRWCANGVAKGGCLVVRQGPVPNVSALEIESEFLVLRKNYLAETRRAGDAGPRFPLARRS